MKSHKICLKYEDFLNPLGLREDSYRSKRRKRKTQILNLTADLKIREFTFSESFFTFFFSFSSLKISVEI